MTLSNRIRHFFHVVSNVRPVIWIGIYLALIPVFALFYHWLPDNQFRLPDGAGTEYGSWLYYSIVTITTLGFGDYTPAHVWAQTFTAVEVMLGMLTIGFFLNAVGAMKSEIDVETEKEKQRRVHEALESDKLTKNIPVLLHKINLYLAWCWAVTTPVAARKNGGEFNPDFKFSDMRDMFSPSNLPIDHANRPAVEGVLQCADHLSLTLDSLQQRLDLSLWPQLLENCFAFVSDCQLFSSTDNLRNLRAFIGNKTGVTEQQAEKQIAKAIEECPTVQQAESNPDLRPAVELYYFIKETAEIAARIELFSTRFASTHSEKLEATAEQA